MADPMTDERVTEIVRAATFGKAIRLWDIVRASGLDSQQKEQFRKAIGTVWMRGVRELAREVRRLGEELGTAKAAVIVADGNLSEVEREVEQLRALVRDLTDPDPCYFDHHGGCQAHGYLSLKPGEKCPHAEAKELLDREVPS